MSQALFAAIAAHDLDLLARLLKAGADPNQIKDEWVRLRPLHAAIVALDDGGPAEAIPMLLRHGAGIDATFPDIGGGTPLLTALFNDRMDAAAFLLEMGADPNVMGEEGDSPLRWAVSEGNHQLARQLLAKGADRTIDSYSGIEGMTALGIAASRLDVAMVTILLDAGAAPEAVDLDRQLASDHMPPRTEANVPAWDRLASMLAVKA